MLFYYGNIDIFLHILTFLDKLNRFFFLVNLVNTFLRACILLKIKNFLFSILDILKRSCEINKKNNNMHKLIYLHLKFKKYNYMKIMDEKVI